MTLPNSADLTTTSTTMPQPKSLQEWLRLLEQRSPEVAIDMGLARVLQAKQALGLAYTCPVNRNRLRCLGMCMMPMQMPANAPLRMIELWSLALFCLWLV